MAEVIRRALDAYLEREGDPSATLSATFALIPIRRCRTVPNGTVGDVLVGTDIFSSAG